MKVAMDSYVPESVIKDINFVISSFKAQNAKIKLIRIGYDDFHRVVDAMMTKQFAPFTPTLCGYPVEIGIHNEVDVIAVRQNSPLLTMDILGNMGELGA